MLYSSKNMNTKYMRMAITLAKKAAGATSPNPLVGAVVVKNGAAVGTGYHQKCGLPHAEKVALDNAGALAMGADMYVNLEPCNHIGRTPPCTDAIIQAGIKRVYVAIRDPNPLVNGSGIAKLRKEGIEVHEDILREEAYFTNEIFFKHIRTGLPFVALKAAASIDGKIATKTGKSQWITGEESRKHGHGLRNIYDAILVGIGTVKADNPALSCRLPGKKTHDPIKIIIDSKLSIDGEARVFDTDQREKVIIATTRQASQQKAQELREKAKVLIVNNGDRVSLPALMQELGKIEITSVLVEGGSRINASFLEAELVDKFFFYVAPVIVGGDDAAGIFAGSGPADLTDAPRLHSVSTQKLGKDMLIIGYREKPPTVDHERNPN